MGTTGRKIVLIAIGMMSLIGFSLPSFGEHDHESNHPDEKHDAQEEHRRGPSPLIEEMIRLDAVFRDVVSGVALGDGKRVHEAIETMHGAMEKTHEGIHHGAVTLRKNAHRLNEFIALDKQFHKKLERLGRAAHKNDQAAMLSLTKQLLEGCVQCHRDFRTP